MILPRDINQLIITYAAIPIYKQTELADYYAVKVLRKFYPDEDGLQFLANKIRDDPDFFKFSSHKTRTHKLELLKNSNPKISKLIINSIKKNPGILKLFEMQAIGSNTNDYVLDFLSENIPYILDESIQISKSLIHEYSSRDLLESPCDIAKLLINLLDNPNPHAIDILIKIFNHDNFFDNIVHISNESNRNYYNTKLLKTLCAHQNPKLIPYIERIAFPYTLASIHPNILLPALSNPKLLEEDNIKILCGNKSDQGANAIIQIYKTNPELIDMQTLYNNPNDLVFNFVMGLNSPELFTYSYTDPKYVPLLRDSFNKNYPGNMKEISSLVFQQGFVNSDEHIDLLDELLSRIEEDDPELSMWSDSTKCDFWEYALDNPNSKIIDILYDRFDAFHKWVIPLQVFCRADAYEIEPKQTRELISRVSGALNL